MKKGLICLSALLAVSITITGCGKKAELKVGKQTAVAVKDGKITRNAFVNVYRGDEKILETQIEALKIQKDDKAEVNYGYECGIKLKDSTGIQVGDIFEVYEKVEIKRG